jgi:uncharacterized membrane protein
VESHLRSIVKAISWRFWATIITFCVALAMTGKLELAATIGIADTLIKLLVYYSHERLWTKIGFGQKKPPEYQI